MVKIYDFFLLVVAYDICLIHVFGILSNQTVFIHKSEYRYRTHLCDHVISWAAPSFHELPELFAVPLLRFLEEHVFFRQFFHLLWIILFLVNRFEERLLLILLLATAAEPPPPARDRVDSLVDAFSRRPSQTAYVLSLLPSPVFSGFLFFCGLRFVVALFVLDFALEFGAFEGLEHFGHGGVGPGLTCCVHEWGDEAEAD